MVNTLSRDFCKGIVDAKIQVDHLFSLTPFINCMTIIFHLTQKQIFWNCFDVHAVEVNGDLCCLVTNIGFVKLQTQD